MAKTELFSDPDLHVVVIDDFTPGIHRFSRGNLAVTFSTQAPLGSASHAFRCYAIPKMGLCPFPTHTTYYTYSQANVIALSMGAIQPLGPASFTGTSFTGDYLVFSTNYFNSGGSVHEMDINVLTSPGLALTAPYTNTTATPSNNMNWANFDIGVFVGSNVPVRGIITVDPFNLNSAQFTWVTVPSLPPSGLGNQNNGVVTLPVGYAGTTGKVFYANGRMVVGSFSTSGFYSLPAAEAQFFSDPPFSQTPFFGTPNFFNPEFGSFMGAWGSISTGEVVIIYGETGGVLINGDIGFPTTTTRLPGIVGTGSAVGPGIESPLGLIYVTDTDGIWAWNGGNSSKKISEQIPDDQFLRVPPVGFSPTGCNTHNDIWDNWAFFANNWVYDCQTNSWWLCEDPNVMVMDIFCKSTARTQWFYSAPSSASAVSNSTLSVPIQRWDMNTPALSYSWISNPISNPGSLVSLEAVEIVASNMAATPAKIVITPVAPLNQTPFPNQNANQAVTFTIPATTAGYRQSQRLGWNDYNICIRVDASNTATSAPIVQEISLGFSERPSAAP